ncbi:hypothetical protein SDC9_146096 [bioreactor metagenome]|uniref:Uncharacterized protein n=1 Tax=bioreactor metagenome TaxID=1076179 RepID=A0A645EB64_9ZZZZ
MWRRRNPRLTVHLFFLVIEIHLQFGVFQLGGFGVGCSVNFSSTGSIGLRECGLGTKDYTQ